VNETVLIDNDVNIGLANISFSNLTLSENASLTIEVSNGKSGTITITGCGNLAGTLILNVTDIDHSENVTLLQYPFFNITFCNSRDSIAKHIKLSTQYLHFKIYKLYECIVLTSKDNLLSLLLR
jgi:hypothetical protein